MVESGGDLEGKPAMLWLEGWKLSNFCLGSWIQLFLKQLTRDSSSHGGPDFLILSATQSDWVFVNSLYVSKFNILVWKMESKLSVLPSSLQG